MPTSASDVPASHVPWQRFARVLAMQALTQLEAQGDVFFPRLESFVLDASRDPEIVGADLAGTQRDYAVDYALWLAREAWTHRQQTDEQLTAAVPNWSPQRIGSVERALIRVALREFAAIGLLQSPLNEPGAYGEIARRVGRNLTPRIIINEAVELARIYGDKGSPAFVNGVLDAIHHGSV
ncbi:MAG: transcription antitermination protein NusB [Phycisphaerae bacterium]|nr:transcription antitermination protein NusB [Phycisphaerae bacterium]NUQ44995.1 transcription antitermination protein NusB [Phycisphaerae bacterium]